MDSADPGRLPALIEERLGSALREGRVPQIILDLDGTLFDNVPRTRAILLDAARHLFGDGSAIAGTVRGLAGKDFEYNPIDTLRRHGVGDEDALLALREEWARRFFDSGYLGHDTPLAGAVDVARSWWERGAELNYLTGRHVPEMFPGTSRSLHQAGFPIGTLRTQLLMKPRFDLDDVAFKVATVPAIRRKGPVALLVDNDPRVLNPLARELPEALAVMVRTLHPREAPALSAHIPVVRDFHALAAARPRSGDRPSAEGKA